MLRIAGDKRCRTADVVAAQGEIAHDDVEPVVDGNAQVAAEGGGTAIRIGDLDLDGMRTRRQDLLDGEFTLRVDGQLQPQRLHGLAGLEFVAVDGDGAAVHGNVAQGQAVFAVAGETLALDFVLVVETLLRLVPNEERQRLETGLVETSFVVIDAQQIEHFFVGALGWRCP